MRDCSSIRVVIADDHTVVREGLTAIINRSPGMTVVAEARDWPEAIRKVIAHHAQIALLDLRMPGMSASDGVSALHRKCPGVGIVLISAFDREEEVYGVIQAGARGFLLKDCTLDELRACLRAVHEGKTWLAPEPAARLAARVQAPELTGRQIQVLELLTDGKSNKEIGTALNIMEGTVKVHVNHIFDKLGVRGRTAAIMRALQRGLVRLVKGA